MSKFTHLHLHTEYSILDGVLRVGDLLDHIEQNNIDSCAVTDHGNMYGIYKFWKNMRALEKKPILGCEIYIAPRSRHEKEAGIDNKMYHMVLLAKNQEGYKNLMKIVSIGHMEGFYYKPRVDWETLEEFSNGLIALSGCLGGPVSKEIDNGNKKKARMHLEKLNEIYPDNLYVELQRNYRLDEETTEKERQENVNKKLLEFAKELDLPIVATGDVHYLNEEDFEVQEIVWAIADGKPLEDPTRRRQRWSTYLKSEEEMIDLFNDLPEAISNTQVITDSIEDFSIEWDRIEPPYLDLPEGESPPDHLRYLVEKGAREKYGEITPEIQERIDYELDIINDKGYSNYFLVVYDFVKYCVANKINVGARGSAVGTVVGYTLNIASVDPIKWGLIFERFLNPGRNSPPDIDLDISDQRREDVIRYGIERYGTDQVRLIIAFSKLQTRAAIRDVSRILGIDLAIADRLSKMVEILFGKAKPIDYMIDNNPEFAEIINSSPELQRMSKIVQKVAGLVRGVTTHACGVVVTPTPVQDYVPIQRDSKGEGFGMAQFEMSDLENSGLLKLDFLGLKNLNVIDNALRKIKRGKGIDLDLQTIDNEDPAVYKDLKDAHTVGVFQLESEGMQKTMKRIKPENLEDLCYAIAAYRPGPMEFIQEFVDVKEGKKEPHYILPELEPLLSNTNGVVTYQEQVMQIARDLANYSYGDADNLRRAMGKKKMDVMEAEKPKFLAGGRENGLPEEEMSEIWDLLVKFANYGFNKSHAAAYAMVSYHTAYLKHYYPLEFMAALLESDLDNFDRVVTDLQECDRLGIQVLPPSVNKSGVYFTVDESGENIVRFGMGAIKNVGEDIVRSIVKEREANGEYLNLDDFIYRNVGTVQKRAVQYMVLAGAFDDFGDRAAITEGLDKLFARYKEEKKTAGMGQIDLFGGGNGESKVHITSPVALPEVEEMPMHERLKNEKELLGIYLSSHPLDDMQEFFQEKGAISIAEVLEKPPSRKIIVTGAIAITLRRHTTKNDRTMAFVQLEDKYSSMDAVIFPDTFEEIMNELEAEKPLLIAGKVNERDNGDKSFIIEKAKLIDPSKFASDFKGITFKVKEHHTTEQIQELKKYIAKNGGDQPVRILITEAGSTRVVPLKQKIMQNDKTEELLRIFR